MSTPADSEQIGEIKAPPMPIPATAELEPWTSFPEMEYDFIQSDFAHQNKFALSGHLSHMRGGVEVDQTIGESKTGFQLESEYKVWLDLKNQRSLYARMRSDNVKLHFDNGNRKLWGKDFNFYTTMSCTNKIQKINWRFGLFHNSQHCHADCRLKLMPYEGIYFSLRNIYKSGKFTYGFLGMADLNNRVFSMGNLMLGYKVDEKTNVFLRTSQEHFRRKNPADLKGIFDHFLVNAVTKHSQKTTFAAEIALQQNTSVFKWTQLVLQQTFKNDVTSKLRAKISKDCIQCSATTKFPLPSANGSFSFGLHSVNPHKPSREVQWGTLLEFNI